MCLSLTWAYVLLGYVDKCLNIIYIFIFFFFSFFFQAEDGIRDLVRSRGLGDVYKRQIKIGPTFFVKAGI